MYIKNQSTVMAWHSYNKHGLLKYEKYGTNFRLYEAPRIVLHFVDRMF